MVESHENVFLNSHCCPQIILTFSGNILLRTMMAYLQTIHLHPHPHHQMYHDVLWTMEIMWGMKLPHSELPKVSHLGFPNQTGQKSTEGCIK